MVTFSTALISFCIISSAVALPTQADSEVESKKLTTTNYASDASKIISLNLLKSNIDIDANQAHSPLGVTSLLAVLAEAAAGDTYTEFTQVFGYPKEREELRAAFKRVLGKYQNKEYGLEPAFRTWLYIYRNNTAHDEYKQILRDNYFVEVKDITQDDYEWNKQNTASVDSISLDTADFSTPTNSKDVVGFETLKRLNIEDLESAASSALRDTYGVEVVDKEASKFDRVVDDKQYVEKPVILEEIKKQAEDAAKEEEKKKEEKLEHIMQQDTKINEQIKRDEEYTNPIENETVMEDEKIMKQKEDEIAPIEDILNSNEPKKVNIPLNNLENAVDAASKEAGEIMIALESYIGSVRKLYTRSLRLLEKDDVASALSANSITGRSDEPKTKMLLFNGLYYHGSWAYPFLEKSNEDEFFYMTAEDAVKTPMMHTRGEFHIVDLDHLNARLICLPYENKKYGMAIILPKDIEGLRSVIEKIQPEDFKMAHEKAEIRKLHVVMPKFRSEETSHSESMLKNLGLKKLFSKDEADLSLLADDKNLHVNELVQFVTLRVDEGGNSLNVLSAMTEGRNNDHSEIETIEINRPFLYFIFDCEEEFIIASGKIYNPEFKSEEPVAIEVEYEQS